ncbi:cobalamin biosynthesis protein CbiM [Xanthobacter pseudotagetidis]|uniref:cobalamin biosynthesis protein CbiM n=1 Tax=Xanthobacter pseudotagetidis TaxID=3119911 RepID=UPI00372ACD3D
MRAPRAGLRFALAALAVALAPLPAAAHRLKVFATVEGNAVSGYAFFVGGGRPGGAHVAFRDAAGRTLGEAVTDADGAFAFTPARPEAITVVVDAGDGHAAEAGVAADRFATAAISAPIPAPPAGEAGASAPAPASVAAGADATSSASSLTGRGPAAVCDPAALAGLVETAVARQIRPLLEAEAEAEGRVRFNDVMGGIGMIVGLAGAALWASSRRGARPPKAEG